MGAVFASRACFAVACVAGDDGGVLLFCGLGFGVEEDVALGVGVLGCVGGGGLPDVGFVFLREGRVEEAEPFQRDVAAAFHSCVG